MAGTHVTHVTRGPELALRLCRWSRQAPCPPGAVRPRVFVSCNVSRTVPLSLPTSSCSGCFPEQFSSPERCLGESQIYLDAKVCAQTTARTCNLACERKRDRKGEAELQLLKRPFEICNAKIGTRRTFSLNYDLQRFSLPNEPVNDSPLLEM